MDKTIAILLATYNGEKHIRHQLDSILSQTYKDWYLLIRDDGSTDNTTAIIEEYRNKFSSKIEVIDNKEGNTGSVLNFGALLRAAHNARYILFCDQDDEWMTDKIEITYRKIKEVEEQYNNRLPVIIFTNFRYADAHLQPIESKKNFEVNTKKKLSFSHLLAQNPVYGCTILINRPLADAVGSIPPQAENHDYWIALVASLFGKIFYLKDKTVLYRQHGGNISGSFDDNSLQKRFSRIIIRQDSFKMLRKKKEMLMKLKEIYYPLMNKTAKQTIDDFIDFYTDKSISLFFANIKNGVISQTIGQTLLLYASLLFYKKEDTNSV